MVYIVVYEQRTTMIAKRSHSAAISMLKSLSVVHDTFDAADMEARRIAKDFKCKAWVMAFDDPRPEYMDTIKGEFKPAN